MAERSTRSVRRVDNGHTFIWAFALFAVICGAMLILLGNTGAGTAEEENTESIKSVVIELEAAANALEDKDYGRTRAYLRSARTRLFRLDE